MGEDCSVPDTAANRQEPGPSQVTACTAEVVLNFTKLLSHGLGFRFKTGLGFSRLRAQLKKGSVAIGLGFRVY